jgi:hypothetical protein
MKIIFQSSLVFFTMLLIACDGSNSSDSSMKVKTISGTVSYRHEPITEGTVIVKDSNGQTITSSKLQGESHYSVNLPGNVDYPIMLSFKYKDDELRAVVISAQTDRQDLSSMSTLVVEYAENLGGFSHDNMLTAARNAINSSQTKSGKGTQAGFKGDPTKQFGGWH